MSAKSYMPEVLIQVGDQTVVYKPNEQSAWDAQELLSIVAEELGVDSVELDQVEVMGYYNCPRGLKKCDVDTVIDLCRAVDALDRVLDEDDEVWAAFVTWHDAYYSGSYSSLQSAFDDFHSVFCGTYDSFQDWLELYVKDYLDEDAVDFLEGAIDWGNLDRIHRDYTWEVIDIDHTGRVAILDC